MNNGSERIAEYSAGPGVFGALFDNHTADLVDDVLPDIAAALDMTNGHPDAERLMNRAHQACIDAFPVEDGWSEETGRFAFRLLAGVAMSATWAGERP
ncbi:hypothetical protein ACF1AJ_20530 [Leifsonia sp. NPDC014704]|uniref:hypothetical protein n=1 Tax=Leifsonia sp. NPDC014704 TaxID=3364123 RepID=UPI0036F4AB63